MLLQFKYISAMLLANPDMSIRSIFVNEDEDDQEPIEEPEDSNVE